jgi:hypothetical protein
MFALVVTVGATTAGLSLGDGLLGNDCNADVFRCLNV